MEGYIEILEATLLAQRLSAFESRLRVRERRHPKLYWVDPGIVRGAKKQLGALAIEEKGALFEGFVFHLLRAYHETVTLFDDIFYWSTSQGTQLEVDFLLRRGREHIAIEVKTQDRFQSSMTNGLQAIAELPGLKRRILVYRGNRVLKTDRRNRSVAVREVRFSPGHGCALAAQSEASGRGLGPTGRQL